MSKIDNTLTLIRVTSGKAMLMPEDVEVILHLQRLAQRKFFSSIMKTLKLFVKSYLVSME